MFLKFFLLCIIFTLGSSQMADILTPFIDDFQNDFSNAMNQFSEPFQDMSDDFENFMDNLGRSASYEAEQSFHDIKCPTALLLSCDPPNKIIPALAYDNYDGTWTYCVQGYEGMCYRY